MIKLKTSNVSSRRWDKAKYFGWHVEDAHLLYVGSTQKREIYSHFFVVHESFVLVVFRGVTPGREVKKHLMSGFCPGRDHYWFFGTWVLCSKRRISSGLTSSKCGLRIRHIPNKKKNKSNNCFTCDILVANT